MDTVTYLQLLKDAIDAINPAEFDAIAELLFEACRKDKQVFILGNGGSGATASHIAEDLAKGAQFDCHLRFRITSLTDNTPLIMAWANDIGYESIFVGQLRNFVNAGDVVIGISGSGNSENVLEAIRYAKAQGATTVGLTGMGGGKLAQEADLAFVAPSDNMQRIEDLHLILGHILYVRFVEEFGPKAD